MQLIEIIILHAEFGKKYISQSILFQKILKAKNHTFCRFLRSKKLFFKI